VKVTVKLDWEQPEIAKKSECNLLFLVPPLQLAPCLLPLYSSPPHTTMSANEDIDKHVLRKYEIMQKLGKGVSVAPST
jgi:hypothetical protein